MVLDKLGSGLMETFRKIAKISVFNKETVDAVIRDFQRTLLQADVDVKLVFEISNNVKAKILKEKPPAGLTFNEYFTKTLYDELVKLLGQEKGKLELKPQKIILIGLFGSGKTTTAGKLAKWFMKRGLKPALIACDTHRAAAQEQLRQIGQKIGVNVYLDGKNPEEIAKNALKNAKEEVLIFDSAGRDALDNELAKELKNLCNIIKPDEVLLVIPADIGQTARKQSEEFNKLVGITGVIITKLDGTAKGGGALSACSVGAKVKFIGVGEKIEDIEEYDPPRFVSRLIGYGDIQGLLEKAKEAGAEKLSEKILEGEFTLNEFYEQIKSIQVMGSLNKITEMIPGMPHMKIPKEMLEIQESKMKKWRYMIDSMTLEERKNPEIIKSTRIDRIAKGSGTKPEEVREMLKYYKQIKKIIKMTRGMKRGPFARILKQFGFQIKQ